MSDLSIGFWVVAAIHYVGLFALLLCILDSSGSPATTPWFTKVVIVGLGISCLPLMVLMVVIEYLCIYKLPVYTHKFTDWLHRKLGGHPHDKEA